MLFLHIAIAFTSLGYAAYVFFAPSATKLYASYGLTILTLATGTYLVISKPAHLLQSCTMGLVYLGIILTATALTRHKLARG